MPEYRNPVIYADCPDPTMCRYGGYIYMVTTMHFVPGAPVMRSKDMVHRQTVSYIFDRFDFGPPQYSLEEGKTAYGGGRWATSLVHHDGKFYAWFIAKSRVGRHRIPCEGCAGPFKPGKCALHPNGSLKERA